MSTSYALSIDGVDGSDLVVKSFSGREALSELYAFDIVVTQPLTDRGFEENALGQRAELVMRFGERTRSIHGMVASIEAEGMRHGARGEQVGQYRVELVPRAWVMTQRKQSRIFQHEPIPRVIDKVLGEAGVQTSWRLKREYPRVDYTTQYEETDEEFVRRLLAENGIYFYFEHPSEPFGSIAGVAETALRGLQEGPAGAIGLARQAAEGSLGHEVMVLCDDGLFYPSLDDSLTAEALEAATRFGLEGLRIAGEAIGGTAGELAQMAAGPLAAVVPRPTPTLRFIPDSGSMHAPDPDNVHVFDVRHRLRPDRAEFREFDPRRPRAPLIATKTAEGLLDLAADVVAGGDIGQAAERAAHQLRDEAIDRGLDAAAQAGGPLAEMARAARPFTREHYEHHGHHLFPHWDHVKDEPERMLRSARRDAVVATGASSNARFSPSRRFTLEEHPIAGHNREWVLVEARHEGHSIFHGGAGGHSEPSYKNSFRCVRSDLTHVPPRPARRNIQALLTATVVGPEREEIYCTEMAQVKVRFHWDRDEHTEESSCWIRCMQSWAGAGWGTQFVPRVGSEVVVGFEGGDPDKPIVLGSLYNGILPTPFALAEQRTRSGIRTRTTPTGTGGNELSFEDASGTEQVYLHAQRDLDVHVRHNRKARIEHDDNLGVIGDREVEVRGSERTEVGHAHTLQSASATVHVHGDRSVRVGGQQSYHVGSYTVRAREDVLVHSSGNTIVIAGGEDAPRSYVLHATGDAIQMSDARMRLDAKEELVLCCGNSSLRLTPDSIEIFSPSVVVHGEGARIQLKEDNCLLHADSDIRGVAEKVIFRSTSGASLGLTSEGSLDGSRVLLNSPTEATDELATDTSEPTNVEVVDDDGNAMAYRHFRVVHEDGSTTAGMLDRNGRATLHLEQGAQIEFPDLGDAEAQ